MSCKGCEKPAVGNSKYCQEHRAIAHKAWKEMIHKKAAEREDRQEQFEALAKQADIAGKEAATNHTPTPMHVVQHSDPLDDNSPIVKRYEPVMDGVCGFAWIKIIPGNSSFAHYAKKHLGAGKDYYGGVSISVSGYGQSYERKSKYAEAYASVLQAAGIRAYAGGRLD